MHGFQAKIHVNPHSVPMFCSARSVPYSVAPISDMSICICRYLLYLNRICIGVICTDVNGLRNRLTAHDRLRNRLAPRGRLRNRQYEAKITRMAWSYFAATDGGKIICYLPDLYGEGI